MALSPASSHDNTFNGGTITTPLTIAVANPATPALVLQRVFAQLGNDDGVLVVKDELGDFTSVVYPGGSDIRGQLPGNGTVYRLGAGRFFQIIDADANDAWSVAEVDGAQRISAHAAPADGDLNAGECSLWFDQTNGAAKLMMKAKQADGTVKTGSVNVQT